MKKLLISLLALVMVFALVVPTMAASPVKDYATAEDGDLLYTVNWNGDEAFNPALIVAKNTIMDVTPSADGSELHVKGNGWNNGAPKNQGVMWGGVINGLDANATTKYTMTYQIWIDEELGENDEFGGAKCFIGVGGLVEDLSASSVKYINFTSNYFTANEADRQYSLRARSSILEKDTENQKSGVFDPALAPVKDNGYYTVRLTFDGTTATVTAYILTSGTGANDADWTKVIAGNYNVSDANKMCCMFYAQYSSIDAKIKNVKIFKGLVNGVTASEPSTPTTPVNPSPAPTGDVFTALPVALLVLSGAAIAVVLKKKEN